MSKIAIILLVNHPSTNWARHRVT